MGSSTVLSELNTSSIAFHAVVANASSTGFTALMSVFTAVLTIFAAAFWDDYEDSTSRGGLMVQKET